MNIHYLKSYFGDEFPIHEIEPGHFACPICGVDIGNHWPWGLGCSCDANGKPVGEWFGMGSHDICCSCRTQWGDDDTPEEPPGPSVVEVWVELRKRWLQTVTDREEARRQLLNIGIKLQ